MEYVIVPGLVCIGLVAGFLRLRRSRDRVMGYHGIETPRINETTHGGGGDGGGG